MTKHRRAGTSRRLLAPVVVVAVLGVLAWSLRGGRGEFGAVKAAPASAAAPGRSPQEALLSLEQEGQADAERRSAAKPVEASAPAEVAASRKPKEVPLETENASIVRVQLVDEEGEPKHLAGVDVEVQSWLEDSSDTFRHFVRTDDRGIGTLAFEGMVHVDWFKHEPRGGSGLPFLYSEHHIDVDPGEEWTETLMVTEGGAVTGRVLDTTGAPVAGVEMHLFQEYYMAVVSDVWRPGIAMAVSDERGVFTFPSLTSISWSLAIPPFEWLQIEPSLVEGSEGQSYIEVEPGKTLDVGTFVVAPLEKLDVHVVDLTGSPVEGATVWLEPIALDVPGLRMTDGEEVEELDVWLRGDDPWSLDHSGPSDWTYANLIESTDADGRARILATTGAWVFHAQSNRDVGKEPVFDEALDIKLPRGPLEVRVPARFATVAGRVVDQDGNPQKGVRVVASATDGPNPSGPSQKSGSNGVFRFDHLPIGQPLWFHFHGGSTLPAVHPAELGSALEASTGGSHGEVDDEALPTYAVRAAATLSMKLEVEGTRHQVAWLQVAPVSFEPMRPPMSAAEQLYSEHLRANPPTSRAVGQGREQLHMGGLIPGTYEVTAMVTQGTGAYHPNNGSPVTSSEPWQRERFRTGDPSQVFKIDLSGYEYPSMQPGVQWGGEIRSATNSDSISRVWIELEGEGWTRSSWSEHDGTFTIHCPDEPFELRLAARGHAYHVQAMSTAGSLGSNVQITLEPCATEVALSIRAKHGGLVPATHLRILDEAGEEGRATQGNRSSWNARGWTRGADPLVLRSLLPGRWKVEMKLEGFELGHQWIDVRDTSERQEFTLKLTMSVEELREAILDWRQDDD